MAQSVYKLWQGRFTEAWHQLPQEEQQRLLSQVMEALNKAGARHRHRQVARRPATHLVGKQPTARSPGGHTVFFECRQFAQRGRRGRTLMTAREVV
jgi:hypothetical protein